MAMRPYLRENQKTGWNTSIISKEADHDRTKKTETFGNRSKHPAMRCSVSVFPVVRRRCDGLLPVGSYHLQMGTEAIFSLFGEG